MSRTVIYSLPDTMSVRLNVGFYKVGAVIIRNTRRIRVLLSSSYPYQALFT